MQPDPQFPDPQFPNLSPNGAASNSPGQAPAPPWVLGKTSTCPVGAASQSGLKLVPFQPDPQFLGMRGGTLAKHWFLQSSREEIFQYAIRDFKARAGEYISYFQKN